MAQEYDDSPVWLDVDKVLSRKSDRQRFIYHAKVHTEDEDISVIKMISLSIIRDYQDANADYMFLEVAMPFGDYALKLYPYRDNLEVSIRKSDVRQANEEMYEDTPENENIFIHRYKAIFDKTNKVPSSDIAKLDIETLNNSNIVHVKFQLFEIATLPIFISRVYGNHKGKTVDNILREVITQGTANIEIEGKPSVASVDIYEVDNKEPIKHLVVKDGMHLVEFPRYMQESSNGVYVKGLGTYFQWYQDALRWFIYPIYDTTRFEKDPRAKLIIYSVPTNRYKGSDRTYLVDGDIISIVATSGYDYKDNSQTHELNFGSGIKMQGAKSLMGSPVQIKPDGQILATRVNTTNEVVFQERKDKLNYTTLIPSTNNPYQVYSEVILRTKAEIYVKWEYSDCSLLYPGMGVKYVFYDGESVVEVYGTLAATDTSIVTTTSDMRDAPASETTTLRIYIQPIEKLKDKRPETTTYGEF